MTIQTKLDQWHAQVRGNLWMRRFTVFCRIALAAGFIPSGFVKIMGERFTNLSVNHPMGHYLEALHLTGYYYTFIGIAQVTAAILLLVPRTATLGALLYFPIILNICILSLAVRFDGSLLTSPLMVLAVLYLICWDYDRLKLIIPFNHRQAPRYEITDRKFPVRFFAGITGAVIAVVLLVGFGFDMKPYNTLTDCEHHCGNSKSPDACRAFCNCIHEKGEPLDQALDEYHQALKNAVKK